jgi:prepilin-type N-terminal cleavage/methylation domain-containing protein
MNAMLKRGRKNGFSLVELVIVVVILGIIGAIAIPRMSRGAAGASDSGLVADLAVLRNAIELYAAEHNGTYPTVASFGAQLTTYTDTAGTANASKSAVYKFGPYLNAVPTLKVGDEAGGNVVAAAAASGVAWVYDEDTGIIRANAASPYDTY